MWWNAVERVVDTANGGAGSSDERCGGTPLPGSNGDFQMVENSLLNADNRWFKLI